MIQAVKPNDDRLLWRGTVSREVTSEWVMPWRIPYTEHDLFAERLVKRAAMPAGVCIEFVSNTAFLECYCDSFPKRSPMDLFCDGELHSTLATDTSEVLRFENLGSQSKLIEMWLPQFGEFRLKGLAIDGQASMKASNSTKKCKWITYGSSITQCETADSPSQTWPATVARKHNLDLTCMGYGGQCHLDPMVARTIRDLPAGIISLCLGINIYGQSSLNRRTFKSGLLGFVQILREKHIDTPLLIMSPIYSRWRENTPNDVGFTLEIMRGEIKESVEILKASGDKNVSYVDGLAILGSKYENMLPDDVHPNNEGYAIMASNISNALTPFLC